MKKKILLFLIILASGVLVLNGSRLPPTAGGLGKKSDYIVIGIIESGNEVIDEKISEHVLKIKKDFRVYVRLVLKGDDGIKVNDEINMGLVYVKVDIEGWKKDFEEKMNFVEKFNNDWRDKHQLSIDHSGEEEKKHIGKLKKHNIELDSYHAEISESTNQFFYYAKDARYDDNKYKFKDNEYYLIFANKNKDNEYVIEGGFDGIWELDYTRSIYRGWEKKPIDMKYLDFPKKQTVEKHPPTTF